MKTFLRGWAKYEKLINLILFVIAVVFPLAFSRAYFINIGTLCLVYVLLSLSLNILTGYMGITGLGWAGFFGIGAYTAAILPTKLGLGFFATVLCGGAMTGLAAFWWAFPR